MANKILFKKGHIVSPETREKIRIALIGNKNGIGTKHIITQDIKDKIRKSLIGRKNIKHSKLMSGINSPRYIKDRTKLKKRDKRRTTACNEWSKQVRIRDNWKCRLLNNECIGRLEAHHIFSWRDYPELRFIINNGITLCHFHHPKKWEEEKRLIPIFQELIKISKV